MSQANQQLKAAQLASQRRMEQAERREAKEQERREARAASNASISAPVKQTRKVITSDARAQLRKAAAREAVETREIERVVKLDGSEIPSAHALYEIIEFLKARKHMAEVSFDELKEGVAISLESNPKLLASLRENERVELTGSNGRERLRYNPPFGVRNKGSLAHLLSRTMPGMTEEGPETVLRSKLLRETYGEVEKDIQALVAKGTVSELPRSNDKDCILFTTPQGGPISPDVLKLWKEARVPKGDELQQQLVLRKVITKEELDVRAARKAAARQEYLAQQAANKKSRAPTFRKFTNAHLERPPK